MAVRRDERRALFGGAVDVGRHGLTVPVQLLGRVGVVVDVDDDRAALTQPQERARKLPVVERR